MTTSSTPETPTSERAWWRSRRVLIVGTAAVVLGVVVVGTAYAGSGASRNSINGCVNDRTGVLRVIDPAKGGRCDGRRGWTHESSISWKQTGGGAAGPQGPAGPPGPRGPAGGSGNAGDLTSLEELAGLPCGSGATAGIVRIRIAAPAAGSGISLICQTDATDDPSTRPPLTPAPPATTTLPIPTLPPVTTTTRPWTTTMSPGSDEGVSSPSSAGQATSGTLQPVAP